MAPHICANKTPPDYLAFLRREQIPYLVVRTEHVLD